MSKNKRIDERVGVRRGATLTSPSEEKITASISNVSLGGLLLFNLSATVNDSTEYKIEILAANNSSIFLSGVVVWHNKQYVGMKITDYRFDSWKLLSAFIDDLKTTAEIVNLLDDGWLDYLFEDDKEERLGLSYD